MELNSKERLLIAVIRNTPALQNDISPLLEFIKSMSEEGRSSLEQELKLKFDLARKAYPGTKRGLDVEYENFKKKYKQGYKDIIPLLLPAIKNQIAWRNRRIIERQTNLRVFIPEWKNFVTWINTSSWTMELPEPEVVKVTIQKTVER